MVKIKITKPGNTVAVDFEEAEAEEMFKGIAATLLGMKTVEEQGRKVSLPENAPAQVAAEDRPAPILTPVKEVDQKEIHRHRGFFYIKCEHCGSERAYCVKQPSEYSICTKCGSRTYFTEPLKPLFTICECGKKSRYLTNMTDEMFDINCINCKAPVAVQYNQKRKCYEPIR